MAYKGAESRDGSVHDKYEGDRAYADWTISRESRRRSEARPTTKAGSSGIHPILPEAPRQPFKNPGVATQEMTKNNIPSRLTAHR